MRILDKYILREYIKTFIIIIMAFSVLFIVVDITERLPKLLKRDAGTADIIYYFILRLPYLFTLTSPVVVLLSGLFLMNNLSKYSESIAIRGAGISILRMVTPLIWFSVFFSVGIMAFGEYVLPWAEMKRQYIYTEKIKGKKIEDKKLRSNIHYLGSDKNLYYIGFFDGYRNSLKTIDITTFDHAKGQIKRKISSASASWNGDDWNFHKCYIRNFDEGRLGETEFFEDTHIEGIDVTPIDFIKSAKKPMSMNFFELREYINRLKKVGESYTKELVDLNFKVAFPFANLIIILFSVPLVSTSARSKGRGIIFGIGLLVCFLYLSILRVTQSLGYSGVLSPMFAAWLPHIVFLAVGSYFVAKAEV